MCCKLCQHLRRSRGKKVVVMFNLVWPIRNQNASGFPTVSVFLYEVLPTSHPGSVLPENLYKINHILTGVGKNFKLFYHLVTKSVTKLANKSFPMRNMDTVS